MWVRFDRHGTACKLSGERCLFGSIFFCCSLDLRKKNKSSTTYLILGPPPSKVNTSPISAIRYEKGGDNFPGVWTCHSLVSAYCIRSVAVFVLVRTLHNGYLGSWVVLIITHNPYPQLNPTNACGSSRNEVEYSYPDNYLALCAHWIIICTQWTGWNRYKLHQSDGVWSLTRLRHHHDVPLTFRYCRRCAVYQFQLNIAYNLGKVIIIESAAGSSRLAR